ncbi:hypothetical protein H9Q69_014276 [Fusarium xylarioides]|uniref:Uncharacterized protein n=1 Tax=Fusarium xylarioides TaxID=221167 RepID=A0A9P7IBC9_9HYPO|nr:hypothetical protein H9Q70_014500 [Fusarium xylarioides]KAG5757528.1 hypothetical protein H9Q72_014330 [Fusarium xylarioides]KAG5767445.1 hypothetical protein H9Q73_014236 [Fusarium xylarioides]KAG5786646.1 hypothetical protein H9Q69_014276 [Fusarium xylarioides]KAG5804037.1 hypothetical protein H9Q71_011388 [Fusarium xylarioides]
MSCLELRWEGKSDWWLDGPYGSVKFVTEQTVDLFVRAMSECLGALKDQLLSGTLFSCIKCGNVDAADLFFALWLESANGLTVAGPSTSFLAQNEGAENIMSCLPQAGRWLTDVAHPESVANYARANAPRPAKPADKTGLPPPPERKRSSHDILKSIVDDPKLFEAAIQALEQHRAKPKDASSSDLKHQDSRDIDATYIFTWWNQTGGDLLTLYGAQVHPDWILSVKATPDKHFRTGSTSLAWFLSTGAWAQGEMEGYRIWYAPNGSWFGVNIHCPVQVFGMGTAPYYEVAWSEWGRRRFSNRLMNLSCLLIFLLLLDIIFRSSLRVDIPPSLLM